MTALCYASLCCAVLGELDGGCASHVLMPHLGPEAAPVSEHAELKLVVTVYSDMPVVLDAVEGEWNHNGALCYAMPCYAVLCCAVLCCAMLCYAVLCYAMLCYAMQCYATLCYAMPRYAMLCYAMLCYAMLGRERVELRQVQPGRSPAKVPVPGGG
jgi:hypothetical protein